MRGIGATFPFAGWVFVRSRHIEYLAAACGLLFLAGWLAPMYVIGVPGVAERGAIPGLMAPLALCAIWTMCTGRPSAELERFVPVWKMRLRRGGWYVAGTSALAVSAGISVFYLGLGAEAAATTIRNVAFGVAVATAAAVGLRLRFAWLVPVGVTILVWLFGTMDSFANPEAWAIPHHAWNDAPAIFVTLLLWATAGTVYCLLDGRPRDD